MNLDNMWDFAGLPQPKSIIVPYFINVSLPRGPFRVPSNQAPGSHDVTEDPPQGAKKGKDLSEEFSMEMKEAGISFVRAWFQWNFFEPKVSREGQSNFSFPLDDFVYYMNEAGIRIMGVIGNGYSRFLPEGLNLDDPSQYISRLSESSRQIVRHYKDKIDLWQIENEPNWWREHYSTNWRKGGIWFKEGMRDSILGSLRNIVREESPNSKIVINLEADRPDTNWKFYSSYCDILGLDFYPNYSHSSPIDVSEFRLAEKVKNDTGLPVFIAETGYPSGPSLFGYNETKQAEYVTKACDEALAIDSINAICIWRYCDSYWRSFPIQENHFGLLTQDGREKAAWTAYTSKIRQHGS